MSKFVRDRDYLLAFILIMGIEVYIACFVRDGLIRPYGGDALAVVLLYAFIRSFLPASSWSSRFLPGLRRSDRVTLASLAVLCMVECAQHIRIVERLGLAHNIAARTVIGTSFDWCDFLAYFAGAGTVWLLESARLTSSR